MTAPRDAWTAASIGIAAGLAIVGFVIGFVLLPLARDGPLPGVWRSICSAAGLLNKSPSSEQIVTAGYPMTSVAVSPQMLAGASADSIGRGATLALRCTMCHGARGLSDANSPNLAGQYRITIYKQLVDFKTGARLSAVMGPLAANLSDEDMRDLAAYYAYLPPLFESGQNAPPRIVESGAPLRGIAPCGACHGEFGRKAGAAWLEGQPAAYLREQLGAFAKGDRHNDIDEQMRNVARAMTPQEVEAASRYYAAQP